MAVVNKTWEFNENIFSTDLTGTEIIQNVNFYYDVTIQYDYNDFSTHRALCNSIRWDGGGKLLFNVVSFEQPFTDDIHYIGEISAYDYMTWIYGSRQITFASEHEVSDEFYEWLTYNAAPAVDPVPEGAIATIICDGEVVSYMYSGEVVTLHTKGQVMNGDVSIHIISDARVSSGVVPGLYDEEDNLIASWHALENVYGMDIRGGYDYMTGDFKQNRPVDIITANSELSTGTKMVFPEGLDVIGDYTFYRLKNLTEVIFPKSLHVIGVCAFTGTSLSTVKIPDGCQIEAHSFSNCENLTSVFFPNYIELIESGAFDDCKKLTYVSMPEEVRWICDYAFRNCVNLHSINLPQNGSLELIGKSAFDGCPLYDISLPSGLKTIGASAFSGCLMSQITIPASVEEIGAGAFSNCRNLKNIFVEQGNEHYSNYTFVGDDNEDHSILVDLGFCELIQYPGGVKGNFSIPIWAKVISPCAFLGSVVGEVTLPDSLENIGEFAFSGCANLNILALPKALVTVGSFAFEGCSNLVGAWNEDIGDFMLTISGGLKTVADNMFIGCTSLLHIYIEDGALQIDGDVFLRCTNLISISVPDTIKKIGDSIINEFGDEFEFIFRGIEEAWNNVIKGEDNESWLDKVVFWD